MTVSYHYFEERKKRQDYINNMPEGKIVKDFVYVHPTAGKQIHRVLSNGVVEVLDITKTQLITKIIARPAQLVRLYKSIGEKVPHGLFITACRNKENGANEL